MLNNPFGIQSVNRRANSGHAKSSEFSNRLSTRSGLKRGKFATSRNISRHVNTRWQGKRIAEWNVPQTPVFSRRVKFAKGNSWVGVERSPRGRRFPKTKVHPVRHVLHDYWRANLIKFSKSSENFRFPSLSRDQAVHAADIAFPGRAIQTRQVKQYKNRAANF